MAATEQSEAKGRLRIAVDIGGTFTDLAAFDEAEGKLMFGKALSTHGALVDGRSVIRVVTSQRLP